MDALAGTAAATPQPTTAPVRAANPSGLFAELLAPMGGAAAALQPVVAAGEAPPRPGRATRLEDAAGPVTADLPAALCGPPCGDLPAAIVVPPQVRLDDATAAAVAPPADALAGADLLPTARTAGPGGSVRASAAEASRPSVGEDLADTATVATFKPPASLTALLGDRKITGLDEAAPKLAAGLAGPAGPGDATTPQAVASRRSEPPLPVVPAGATVSPVKADAARPARQERATPHPVAAELLPGDAEGSKEVAAATSAPAPDTVAIAADGAAMVGDGPEAPSPAAASPTSPAVQPAEQMARHIAGQARIDGDRLSLTLTPAELGRVDIELRLDGDGHSRAHILVERPETLELIRQDARQLEASLRDAGVALARDGLSFGLRDDRQPPPQQQQPTSRPAAAPSVADAGLGPRPDEARPSMVRLLDLSV